MNIELLEPVPVGPPANSGQTNSSHPEESGAAVSANLNPLARFSLQDRVHEVERLAVEQKPLLGRVALLGQSTVFYAAPNTGKTLLTLRLLMDAVNAGRVQPEKIFYADMDDTGMGLLDKLRAIGEYGFHTGANGYANFNARELLSTMKAIVAEKSAAGMVIVLDTLKKFVDLMDKAAARQFTALARDFVQVGGTIVALAHTNKKPDANGRAIYSGTTDIVDDFDCAYVIERIPQTPESASQVVLFDNIKSRGGVVRQAAYSFATGGEPSYAELLASVEELEPGQWRPLLEAAQCLSDVKVIEAVEQSIRAGITSKMLLAAAVQQHTGVSRQAAVRIIEKYAVSGDPSQRWTFSRGARGVHQFELLTPPASE